MAALPLTAASIASAQLLQKISLVQGLPTLPVVLAVEAVLSA